MNAEKTKLKTKLETKDITALTVVPQDYKPKINVSVGAAIMTVAIILSLFIGCARGLMPKYNNLVKVFNNGVDGDGYSIKSDLEKLNDAAYNMAALAEQVVGETGNVAEVKEMSRQLSDADSIKEMADEYSALTYDVARLYSEIADNPNLSETQSRLIKQCYNDVTSRMLTIQNDGYNKLAEEYNKELNRLPASVIGRLIGLEEAELFK